jgi:hypothetical protein
MRTAARVLNNVAGCIVLRKTKQKQTTNNSAHTDNVTDENSNSANQLTAGAAGEREEEVKTILLRSQPHVDLFKIQAIQTVQKK